MVYNILQIKSMDAKLKEAEKAQTNSKNFCNRCFPKSFPMEAGTQAVVSTSSVSVQAPPDNEALFDSVQGYTPVSAITEVTTINQMLFLKSYIAISEF
jgi:hypothetical protein